MIILYIVIILVLLELVFQPMNKYPDYCLISIRYNDKVYQFECDIGKYKGTQSTVPRAL